MYLIYRISAAAETLLLLLRERVKVCTQPLFLPRFSSAPLLRANLARASRNPDKSRLNQPSASLALARLHSTLYYVFYIVSFSYSPRREWERRLHAIGNANFPGFNCDSDSWPILLLFTFWSGVIVGRISCARPSFLKGDYCRFVRARHYFQRWLTRE